MGKDENDLLNELNKDKLIILDKLEEPLINIEENYLLNSLEDEYDLLYADLLRYIEKGMGNIEELRKRISDLNSKVDGL